LTPRRHLWRRRGRSGAENGAPVLRHYLYISDTKVDMLLPQLDPSFEASRTVEVGADLKVGNLKRTTASSPGANRILRVERVARRLAEGGHVGTVDAPGMYFRGRLPVQWGPLDDDGRDDSSTVFFGGRDGRTVVGLGGSATHVLGSPADSGNPPLYSPSLLPVLVDALRRSPDIAPVLDTGEPHGPYPEDRTTLSATRHAVGLLRGPAQTVEFVAQTLLQGPSPLRSRLGSSLGDDDPEDRVLLGSPLYVAIVT
jgi:hypothetical protein